MLLLNFNFNKTQYMFKYQSISIYGLMIILAGISLLIKSGTNIEVHATLVSVFILLSAIVAVWVALKTTANKVQSRYHTLHAIGLLFYAILLFFTKIQSQNSQTLLPCFLYFMVFLKFCFASGYSTYKLKSRFLN